jgi:colanic acid/amylovoran biosynthesis protein
MNMSKVALCTDFASLARGTFPFGYEHLHNGICLIPNMRMIDTGACSIENYLSLMSNIIETALHTGHPVYLLNHEDVKDEQLAIKCKAGIKQHIEVVTGLNALQVKGMIASAYLVVSSRFHGVASSLNSCVPCLATSWSHKYQELFRDYGLDSCVLPLDNITQAVEKVNEYLDEDNNKKIREHLSQQVPSIQKCTRQMWDMVWKKKSTNN